jgi:hypothetical protein
MADVAFSLVQGIDFLSVSVEPENAEAASAKFERERQADVSHPDHAHQGALAVYHFAQLFGGRITSAVAPITSAGGIP